MRRYSFQELRAIWPYMLGAIPFLGLFAYQIGVALPHRPSVADSVRGFVIPVGIDGGTVYASKADMAIYWEPGL